MIIYAVKIEDIRLSSILNFVKYLCAPNSKTEIHLSLQGPFKSPHDPGRIQKLNDIIRNASIKVDGFGNFFPYNQNTVYLRCNSNAIKKVWKKDGYSYMPHLTLYDGNDSDFANELYESLKKLDIDISFRASNLIVYDTEELHPSTLLRLGINNETINSIIGSDWRTIDPTSYSTSEKLDLIKKCFFAINDEVEQVHA